MSWKWMWDRFKVFVVLVILIVVFMLSRIKICRKLC